MSATEAPQRRCGEWLESWNPKDDWDAGTTDTGR